MSHFGFNVRIYGLVQGVGFRPFVYKIANDLNIKGEICNDGLGVFIILDCDEKTLNIFLEKIKSNLIPLARIDKIEIFKQKIKKYDDFFINSSLENEKQSPILSDFGICNDCKKELFDEKNPRYLYPFITCTNCGPRFSIIKNLPYDRKNTSMDKFKMCQFCKSEYEDPANRRFHAQPLSCFKCAIKLYLKNKKGEILNNDLNAIKECAKLLKEGKIIAIKGLGGFHLMCDGLNQKAIYELRLRKKRLSKPFALMCKDIKMAKNLAFINQKEKELLESNLSPIVLLKAKKDLKQIAPNINILGIMLAYTPLHLVLFNYFDNPLIATSANISGESIIYKEDDLKKISNVYDYCLTYDRDIINSSDDSIAQVIDDDIMFLRTSRALNPTYIQTNFKNEKVILALGSELKNSFALFYKEKILLSQYLGDMKNIDIIQRFDKTLDFFLKTYDLKIDQILLDKHPNFDYVKKFLSIKHEKIQHHFAHVCSVLFEHDINEEVLAFAFDGTGYGDDKNIWGGEVFLADYKKYKKIACFDEFVLINSNIKNIQNLAFSLIIKYDLFDLASEFLSKIEKTKLNNLNKIYKISNLKTSSIGRIIDAFGSVIFGIENLEYEAQIGLLMQSYYDENLSYSYEFELKNDKICVKNAFIKALKDDKIKACTGFLNALADFIIKFSSNFDKKVILCGGVFQNKILLQILKRKNFKFYTNLKFPCNDSSIALGQIIHYLKRSENV